MAIFLGILAVIGKILLIILYIVLALLALILFVPIRYQAEGKKEEKRIRGGANISWLFHFISFDVKVNKTLGGKEETVKEETSSEERPDADEGVHTTFRILGISPEEQRKKHEEARKARKKQKKKEKIEEIKEKDPDQYARLKEEARARHEARLAAKAEEEERQKREAAAEKEARDRALEKKKLARRMQIRIYYSMGVVYRAVHAAWSAVRDIFQLLLGILLFLAGLPAAIAQKIGGFFAKMTEGMAAAEKWISFLTEPAFTSALGLVLRDIKKLLVHISPRKLAGEVSFGTEDPGTTGEILAVASAFYPKYGGKVRINPDFSGKSHFAFDLAGAGRIYLFYIVYLLLGLVFSRDARYVWHFIKNEKQSKEEAA